MHRGIDYDFVGFECGRLYDNLYAVFERPFGSAESVVVDGFGNFRAFEFGIGRDKRLFDGVVGVCLDRCSLNLGDDGLDVGLRRVGYALFLGSLDRIYLIVVGNVGLDYLIDVGKRQLLD